MGCVMGYAGACGALISANYDGVTEIVQCSRGHSIQGESIYPEELCEDCPYNPDNTCVS